MKTKIIMALCMAATILFSSCDHQVITALDEVTTVEYGLSDYQKLEIAGDFEVYVRFSETEESIAITANDNLHRKIDVLKSGNTLKIGLENKVIVRGNPTLRAYITTRNITDFEVYGDSSVDVEDLILADNASVTVHGDSYFTGEMDVDRLRVDLRGDSTADLFGYAENVNARLSGDSTLRDFDLQVVDLVIDLTGDSQASLYINGTIDVEASGDSVLNYQGNATVVHQHLTGDSKVWQRN